MTDRLYALGRRMLLNVEPEQAHELSLKFLTTGFFPPTTIPQDPRLATHAFGLRFPNPIGIAAGFDKNARVPDAILKLGFGFAEVGTVTPKPQSGNPKPRVFRLVDDQAVINRLGFNNDGHEPALRRLKNRQGKGGIVGVNIGANKQSSDRITDYVSGISTFIDDASYFMVNISSPNTPGLRDLQSAETLDTLLSKVLRARDLGVEQGKAKRPVLVKLAPDLAEDELEQTVKQLEAHNIDGIAISNTTLSRHGLSDAQSNEGGGLSGKPLFDRSTIVLARVFEMTGGRIPLVGIGGIDSGKAAVEKIKAGATLIQLYTALIYHGPALIRDIIVKLQTECETQGLSSLEELRGKGAKSWAAKAIDETSP